MKYLFKFKDGSESIEDLAATSVDDAVNQKCGSNTEGLESCTPLDDGVPPPPKTEPAEDVVEPEEVQHSRPASRRKKHS